MTQRQSIKDISYGYTIDNAVNVYDNDTTIGFFKVSLTGVVFAKSISGVEATFSGVNAINLAKAFLCTYKNHGKSKVKRQPKYQDNYKLNLL